MQFSMNGFRRQLSGDAQSLRDVAESIINDEFYDKGDLAEAVNALIRHSNVLNCVSQKGDPEFVDMSDIDVEELEVPS
ncbi:hypothetical protein RSO41_12355 [Halomonas sp. I1]|uniref:hypothetical protein n=1 Tax=Halomonas sp. I1 TaxID=393536 RepID=UPI0028DFFC33|nr:hypothetical protein [Halomonas sp. I1]MDT8895448.1 hypothetical protein [Halomonas sp. I1]